jgi:endo-1,4-beta-mannosidase
MEEHVNLKRSILRVFENNKSLPEDVTKTLWLGDILSMEMGQIFWLLKPFDARKDDKDDGKRPMNPSFGARLAGRILVS